MFEIAEKLGSFSLSLCPARCCKLWSDVATLWNRKKFCSLTGKKKKKNHQLSHLVVSAKLEKAVLCLGRKGADGLRMCWDGAGAGVPTPPLLILRKKYIVFDFLLFISHPLHQFFFLCFSRTRPLPTVLQAKLVIFVKFHGLSSCKKQKERSSGFYAL